LNGAVKASQDFPLHVANYTSVCNGEVGVGSGSDGIGSGDCVIQFKANYSELVDINFGEDEKELLQVEEQAHNEELFVQLEHNQNFWFTWNQITSMWAFLKLMTILLLSIVLSLNE